MLTRLTLEARSETARVTNESIGLSKRRPALRAQPSRTAKGCARPPVKVSIIRFARSLMALGRVVDELSDRCGELRACRTYKRMV
jgi:hypothetical protein